MNLATHQGFYRKTSALASELKTIENEVKQQEQQLISKVNHVVATVRDVSRKKPSKNPVDQYIQTNLEQISHLMSRWEGKVKSYQTNLEFRKDFGDSLLVFVYGKVKAGKSSLGNYIATAHSDPTPEWLETIKTKLHKPQFLKRYKIPSSVRLLTIVRALRLVQLKQPVVYKVFVFPALLGLIHLDCTR
ncbi:TPA: hypothetical protein ACP5TQ_001626 [Vibrio parahaemolyticus]